MVGLIPLFAVEVLDGAVIARLPEFAKRLHWFLEHRPELANLVSRWMQSGNEEQHLLSLLRGHRMNSLLRRMLDETEFLSDYGVRSISKYHEKNPFELRYENMNSRNGTSATRAWRVDIGRIWRKFQLAWPDLDAGQFPADRVALSLSSVLR